MTAISTGLRLDDSHRNGYTLRMSTYSVAQARDNLSKLISAAERGEEVRIQRNGRPAVRLISDGPKDIVIDLEELKRRQIVPEAGPTDIVEIMAEMRRDRSW